MPNSIQPPATSPMRIRPIFTENPINDHDTEVRPLVNLGAALIRPRKKSDWINPEICFLVTKVAAVILLTLLISKEIRSVRSYYYKGG
jgi:hypothetical protein